MKGNSPQSASARGFTLIESVIAAGILATAAVATASLFISSIRTNLANRERATATMLLYEKMEDLKSAAEASSDGSDSVSTPDSAIPYVRVWQVRGTTSRTITIVVFARDKEVARSATIVSRKW